MFTLLWLNFSLAAGNDYSTLVTISSMQPPQVECVRYPVNLNAGNIAIDTTRQPVWWSTMTINNSCLSVAYWIDTTNRGQLHDLQNMQAGAIIPWNFIHGNRQGGIVLVSTTTRARQPLITLTANAHLGISPTILAHENSFWVDTGSSHANHLFSKFVNWVLPLMQHVHPGRTPTETMIDLWYRMETGQNFDIHGLIENGFEMYWRIRWYYAATTRRQIETNLNILVQYLYDALSNNQNTSGFRETFLQHLTTGIAIINGQQHAPPNFLSDIETIVVQQCGARLRRNFDDYICDIFSGLYL